MNENLYFVKTTFTIKIFILMYISTLSRRTINKKLKLVRNIREQYAHSNLTFFPRNYRFMKKVLIPDDRVLKVFSTVLLVESYDLIILDSVFNKMPNDIQRLIKKRKEMFIMFIESACIETADCSIESVLKYHKSIYPGVYFDILSVDNIMQYYDWDMILSCRNRDYIDFVSSTKTNVDQKSSVNEMFENTLINPNIKINDNVLFNDYYTDCETLHRLGNIMKGTLMVSSLNNTEGEVLGSTTRIKVKGLNLNRATHGDEVYLEENRIVGVSKTKLRVVVGTLFKIEEIESFRVGYIQPIDNRLPIVRVLTSYQNDSINNKVIVHIKSWDCDEKYPWGVIFKVIGKSAILENEITAVMENYGITYGDQPWLDVLNNRRESLGIPILRKTTESNHFNDSDPIISNNKQNNEFKKVNETDNSNVNNITRKCEYESAEELGFDKSMFSVDVAYDEIKKGVRKDLRNLDVCSIDPIGCKDIDDALHFRINNGYIEVGVHIADVSLYVKEGSELDREAQFRSTTVYYPHRRIDMLPGFLSTDLCSLRENEDRAAFSCIWKLDNDGNIVDIEICRSVIRSRAAFSYEEAYSIISCEEKDKDALKKPAYKYNLRNNLCSLLDIATKLRNRRFDKGALELSTQEIYMDENKKIKVKESVPTHYLVEEFMLLANITIAKFIFKGCPEYALLRKHPLPSAIDLDVIDCTSSKTINDTLGKLELEQQIIVKRIVTRSMQQALYFSSGESSDFYHYGLATDIYTHFTSPIRRYPDIIVHRTVSYILENAENKIDGLLNYVNERKCTFMNYRHRNAQNSSRMVDELFLCKALSEGGTGKFVEGVVVCIKEEGVGVFIREYGIEEFVSTNKKFNVFDKVNLQINADFDRYCIQRRIEIKIVE